MIDLLPNHVEHKTLANAPEWKRARCSVSCEEAGRHSVRGRCGGWASVQPRCTAKSNTLYSRPTVLQYGAVVIEIEGFCKDELPQLGGSAVGQNPSRTGDAVMVVVGERYLAFPSSLQYKCGCGD